MEFNSIEEIYEFLERDIKTLKRQWELTSGIRKFFEGIEDIEVKNKLKWECFALDFQIQNGEVKPVWSSPSEDGITLNGYPLYKDFDDSGFAYLKQRAASVKSDYLVSRYHHILWNSPAPHKHNNHAKAAVDAYLRILKQLKCVTEEKRSGRDCLELLKNGFAISLQSKYRINDFKTIIKEWLFERNKFPKDSKVSIVRYMLEISQLKKEDFTGILNLLQQIITKRNKKLVDYFFNKETCEIALKVAQKTGTDTKIWNKRIGDSFIKMADNRMDDESRMIPLSFIKDAIPFYKNAGLDQKVRAAEQKYFELKKELKLNSYPIVLDEATAETLDNEYREKATALMELESEHIFGFLLRGQGIFPKKVWLQAQKQSEDSKFLDLFTPMRFDINNNVSKQRGNDGTKEAARLYEQYHYYLRMTVLPFLHKIFIKGIIERKITFPLLMKFFAEHTWYGQELIEYDAGGTPHQYNWLSMIAPSIHEYFIQIESALRSNNPYTNFIMPIDSLTLKFEGVLRDFTRILGVSTTTSGKGNVLREKYIEELLAEEKIQQKFNEDDLLLFHFLFVSKDGINLRNDIAHSFYRYNNYSFDLMHLLICAFLRMGKYRMRKNQKG